MPCPKEDRDLGSLNPAYAERFLAYLRALRETFPQFDVIVTETRRSDERQACLRKTGASDVVRSNHQDGNALDIALLRKSTGKLDYRQAVFRNVYRLLDPRAYGLTSGAHLWDWDEGHLQIVEAQGPGRDLGDELESYPTHPPG